LRDVLGCVVNYLVGAEGFDEFCVLGGADGCYLALVDCFCYCLVLSYVRDAVRSDGKSTGWKDVENMDENTFR
jgi:hypothetical protein